MLQILRKLNNTTQTTTKSNKYMLLEAGQHYISNTNTNTIKASETLQNVPHQKRFCQYAIYYVWGRMLIILTLFIRLNQLLTKQFMKQTYKTNKE